MNLPDYSLEEFHFQLDEFYLDLQEDGRKICILDKEKIRQRPFPGLRPFKTSEFQLFKGRDGQAEELIKRLKENHFLAVIGSSGTGKSSLVRAGLIPQLFGGYLHEAGTRWNIAICRPGNNPVESLAVALAQAKDPGNNKEVLYNNYRTIYPALCDSIFGVLEVDEMLNSSKVAGEKANLLIIVDQFEELFRFDRKVSENENIESYFVNLLLKASMNTEGSVYVIITMRSEFLGDCVKYRGLPEAINKGQYLVPQLSRQQLKEVIVGPVSLAEKKISPGLVELLINQIDENKLKENLDQLPILQHALMRTYQYATRSDNDAEINYEDYKAIGGMDFALAHHAESKYMELGEVGAGTRSPSKKQKIAKIIFQALTDASSDQKGGRRPIELKYLYAIAESLNATKEEVDFVVDHFRDPETSFIMPPANTSLYPGLVMDISHESLMRNWSRLDEWMKEEVQLGKLYKTLNDRRELNEQKDSSEFVRGILLEELLNWRIQYPNNATWASRYHQLSKNAENDSLHLEIYRSNLAFLEASDLKAREEVNAKELQLRQEMERIQKEKTRRKIIRVFAAAAVISVFCAFWAFAESNKAMKQTRLAIRKTDSLKIQSSIAEDRAHEANEQRKKAAFNFSRAEEQRIIAQKLKDSAEAYALQIEAQKNQAEEQNEHLQKHLVTDILKKRPFYLSKMLDSSTKEKIIQKLFNDPIHAKEEIEIGKHIDTAMLADVEQAVFATERFQRYPVEGLRMAEKLWAANRSDIIQDILSEFFNSNLFYSQQLRPSSYGVPSDYSPSISLAVSQSEGRFAFSNATQIFIGKSDDSHMSIDRGYNLSDIVYNDPGSAGAMGRQAEVLTFWFGEPDNVLSFHRDGKIFEWNAGGCREVGSPVSETNTLLLSKFSSDGRFLITASRDGALKKWDVKQKSYVSTFRDSTILNRYLKKIVFSKNGGRMIKILSNKLQLWNMFADTALRVHPEAIYAQMATFSHDGQHMLVFDSYNTLYLFDSLGRRKASMKISFPNSGESSYDFLNAGIYDLVLSPDWKKLLIKHGSRYVMYSNANPNDPLVRIGENLSYKIDSNLRSRRLTALPYPAVEAFFADDQTIISMDGLGFISRWEIKNNFNNVGQAFSDIKQITAETYQEKENNSLLRFDQVIKSKNLDTLKSAAAFYYQKSRTDTIDLAPQNLQKAKKLYETLLKIDTASFLQKSYYNSLLIFNDELYALERPKRNRDYRFMIECIKQNVDFLEQELKRQPLNSNLKKRLSDYYWPMSFYQLFISSENQGAINSALRGLELYPLNDGINTNLALGYFLTGEYDKADSIYRKFKDAYYSSRVGDGFRNAFIGDFKALERDGVIRIDNPEIYNRMMYIRKEILGEK